MITIKEIAKQLNLSATTVSNVIHGKTKEVSPVTIERVQNFLEEVEYVPNINARNLAQNQSKIIGVVLKAPEQRYSHILTDPFVAEMLGGIEETIRLAGYFMMVYISDDIAEIINHVETWNADGLILFCMLDDDAMRVQKKYRKPIACIDAYVSEAVEESFGKDFFNIGLDDVNGTYEAVSYLIEKGHQRIGFVADNRDGVYMMRFCGYRRALEEHGIEYSDRNLMYLDLTKGKYVESLSGVVEKADNVTAFFCCSDVFAVDLIKALQENGRRVPEDVSVMGFDDGYIGTICTPKLTTMHQSAEEKGRIAAEELLKILNGIKPKYRQKILVPRLVERESVQTICL